MIVRDETLCLVVFQNFDAFFNGATSHNLIFDRENTLAILKIYHISFSKYFVKSYLLQYTQRIQSMSIEIYVSNFLYVGGVKISCGLLPTRFTSNFVLNSITVKICEISNTFLTIISKLSEF